MAKQLGLGKQDDDAEEVKPASKPVDPAHASSDTVQKSESGPKG